MFEMSHCQCYGLLSDVLPEVSNFHKYLVILESWGSRDQL